MRRVSPPPSTSRGCVFRSLDAVPADRESPFRLRLRIALTEAGAIEGEGGRGGPPSVEPELSSKVEPLCIKFSRLTKLFIRREAAGLSLVAAEGRAGLICGSFNRSDFRHQRQQRERRFRLRLLFSPFAPV